MKNHELLDLIGEVNGDYVLAADGKAARPRLRWRAAAAMAACAALVLGLAALPSLTAQPPAPEGTQAPDGALVSRPGLHDYVLFGQAVITTTEGEAPKRPLVPYAPAGGGDVPGRNPPAPDPEQPPRGSGPDVPSQEEARAQYDRLLRWMGGVDGQEPAVCPDWFGGMWLDGETLAVAVVDSLRTPALEEQLSRQAGGEVLIQGVKYSKNYLDGLMDGVTQVFEELDVHISSVYGVYVMDNCLGLDFYGQIPSDALLAALAELDPAGDAIRIQVFAGGSLQVTDEEAANAGQDAPADALPGGARPEAPPQDKGAQETPQPACYDLLTPGG